MTSVTPRQALEAAIRVCGGTPSALAAAIGGKVLRQHVEYWLERGAVPARYCPSIERETQCRGERIRCEWLDPDTDWGVLRKRGECGKPAQRVSQTA